MTDEQLQALREVTDPERQFPVFHRERVLIRAAIEEIDKLRAACEAVVSKYDELCEGSDTEYAAFFTALGKEVWMARAAIRKAKGDQ